MVTITRMLVTAVFCSLNEDWGGYKVSCAFDVNVMMKSNAKLVLGLLHDMISIKRLGCINTVTTL
jgi:hypothetical protein